MYFDWWNYHQVALMVTTHKLKYKEASVLYSHCDIELDPITADSLFIKCNGTALLLESQPLEFSTDKQAVTHCFDIVYGHITAGRHLIGLARTFIYI